MTRLLGSGGLGCFGQFPKACALLKERFQFRDIEAASLDVDIQNCRKLDMLAGRL